MTSRISGEADLPQARCDSEERQVTVVCLLGRSRNGDVDSYAGVPTPAREVWA
jgi:hypothetical protein